MSSGEEDSFDFDEFSGDDVNYDDTLDTSAYMEKLDQELLDRPIIVRDLRYSEELPSRNADSRSLVQINSQLGRPTKYSEDYDDLARKFCLLGARNEDLAKLFEVDISTLERWIGRFDSFRGSILEGRDIADANMASSMYHKGIGYSHEAVHITSHQGQISAVRYMKHYPPDIKAGSLWLRNRRPDLWQDKKEVDISGEIDLNYVMIPPKGDMVDNEMRDASVINEHNENENDAQLTHEDDEIITDPSEYAIYEDYVNNDEDDEDDA